MALTINTNIQSISAQNAISRAQMDQSEAMERLTTGKRINSAADDAAGLAIANKMTSQIKGLNQAVRNANDGISMIQTANGALEETDNILQRMRELAVQSASGTYEEGNRDSLNAEVTQLKAELDRIAETTTFNGISLFDEDLGDISLQVGANASETMTFSIGSTAADDLGTSASADIVGSGGSLVSSGFNISGASVTINGQAVLEASMQTGTAANNADDLQGVIDNLSVAGVQASTYTEITAFDTADTTNKGTGVINTGETITFTRTNLDGTSEAYAISNTSNMSEVVTAINDASDGKLTASLNDEGRLVVAGENLSTLQIAHSGGAASAVTALGIATAQHTTHSATLKLESTNPFDTDGITIAYANTADAGVMGIDTRTNGAVTGQTATSGALAAGDLIINGVEIGAIAQGTNNANQRVVDAAAINLLSGETGVVASVNGSDQLVLTSTRQGEEISVEFKDGGAATAARVGLYEQSAAETQGLSVSNIDISTAAGASKAIGVLDDALEQVSKIQGEMGAINNRLDFTVSNLSNVSESQSAARSAIQDADFAAESANLSRAQVLQQAGQAMLAQANSAPQQVLSLLQ